MRITPISSLKQIKFIYDLFSAILKFTMKHTNQPIKIKTSPKDFFLHLLSILALYFSAISFLVLIFQYINIWIPDQLDQTSYELRHYVYLKQIRWSLASLIVIFPTYILSS